MSVDERKAKKEALVEQCKTKEGASDADAKVYLDNEVPTSHGGKCLGACIMETIGIVCDDQNISQI